MAHGAMSSLWKAYDLLYAREALIWIWSNDLGWLLLLIADILLYMWLASQYEWEFCYDSACQDEK